MIILGCLVFIITQVSAQTSPLAGSLTIKGKINGLAKGTANVTTEVFGEKHTFNAAIVNGKFEMKINQPSPTLYSLTIEEDPAGRALFFAENGTIQVEAVKGDLSNAKVVGSMANNEFAEYNMMISNYDFLLNTIQEVWADLQEKGELFPKMDSLRNRFQRTQQKKDSAIATWVVHHKNSYVSPLVAILNYANNGDPVFMRQVFNGYPANVKMSYYGNFLEGVIARKEGLSIGKLAPLFSQPDPNGKLIALESFRGKYVLIDFWASWCGPCREENPNVVRTYQKFKNKNFEILGVSLDRPGQKESWLAAITKDGLSWPQVSDLKFWQNEAAVQYGVQSIPANFLLDKEGKIVAKDLRGPALEQTLERLLATEDLKR